MSDLASMLVQRPSGGVRCAWGEILSWNPETFENVIGWGDVKLENLPVLAGTDALSWGVGQKVVLQGWDPEGTAGATSWWITGRLLVPGSDNAESMVSFLRGQLASEIAAEIFADRISSDFDPLVVERNLTTWGDPTNGVDPGPTVTVNVSPAGKALVLLGYNSIASSLDTASVFGYEGGTVGFEVSGATSLDAGDNLISRGAVYKYSGSGVSLADGIRVITTPMIAFPIDVNPGENIFTMKYARSGAADLLLVDNRSLTVIAF